MHKNGKLIIFEGPDSIGKSLLTKKLYDILAIEKIDCCSFSFPGKESKSLGKLVYDLHHRPSLFDIKPLLPLTLQIMHTAAHIEYIKREILPALIDGKTVILDRYWWSTLVYGIVSGVKRSGLENLIDLEIMEWEGIYPSAVFLIETTGPYDEKCETKIWHRLKKEYKHLANAEMNKYPIYPIKNNQDIHSAIAKITTIVNEKIIRIYSGSKTNVKKPHDKFVCSKSKRINDEATKLNTNINHTDDFFGLPVVFTKLSPAEPTEVYDTYWKFAAERQNIFFRRYENLPGPWTEDPILSKHKFTNAYRASDRVSQYLISEVILKGNQSINEVFFRILLFKTFNRVDTWEYLVKEIGTICYSDYSFKRYNSLLEKAMSNGQRIYSAAYIMASGASTFGYSRKHSNHLKLIESMMHDEVPDRISESTNMQYAFDLLQSYPTIGEFLAFQYVIDINYSKVLNFDEKDFVVPGPGAKDGIRKCFSDLGGLSEVDIIMLMMDRQEEEFTRLGLEFKSLWGRRLQPIDCQNLFCEVGKYARLAHPEVKGLSGRTRIKQWFRPKSDPISYIYPPKWGINNEIPQRQSTKVSK